MGRDEWTKTTDAFLKNIGTTTNKVNEQTTYASRPHGVYGMENSNYPERNVPTDLPYYPRQHSSSMGIHPMSGHYPATITAQQFNQNTSSSQGHLLDRNGQIIGRTSGGQSISPHDMGSRNVDSGHSSSRNANQDVDRVEVNQNRRRDGSNEESSDSSSSANERGRKKEKSSGTKRK